MAPAQHDPARPAGHRITVVGGGMAAARLVQQLAARGGADGGTPPAVTVIGEETHAPYNRVLLADVLAGRYAPEVIGLPAPPSAAAWLTGVRAVRLDRAAGEVHCDDGRRVPYDSLVLATGSNPVLPPLRGLFGPDGHDLPEGVHAFRTLDDCLALAAAVRPGTRAVVIGGGLLGVSAARALASRDAQVVLAQQGERLMERQLDAGASRLLHGHLTELGVEVHTECRVRGLRLRPVGSGGPDRAVSAVELADGFRLDADLVVLACGVRPRLGLARAAGLRTGRGIVVDDRLRTSDPRIHAIGDCAEHNGVLYGLAGPAQEQADALAALLTGGAGDNTPGYTGTRSLTRLTLSGHGPRGSRATAPDADVPTTGTAPDATVPPTGTTPDDPGTDVGRATATGPATAATTTTASAPLPEPDTAPRPFDLAAFGETEPAPGDDVIHLSDATRGAYRKVVVRGDRLVGGILLGDLGTVGALARTWEGDEPLPSAPLLHLLTNDGGS
ncbi:NAD(P)/FAD-dependent oxidoreductase [Streptomyces sp. bgisy100]|uniref:NAD(P)/FAD-dependent oxidoreductase n=1 Tax=Streptomyces sp. bgisy100 TaxID=3413783 RepID=UPI003D74A384